MNKVSAVRTDSCVESAHPSWRSGINPQSTINTLRRIKREWGTLGTRLALFGRFQYIYVTLSKTPVVRLTLLDAFSYDFIKKVGTISRQETRQP